MAALHSLLTQWQACGLTTDYEWLRVVRAVQVFKHNTPVDVLQLAAGDHQAGQSDVHAVAVSGFLGLFVESSSDIPLERRLLMAVQKAGWPRPAKAV